MLYSGLTATRSFGNGAEIVDEGVSHRSLCSGLLAANLVLMLLPPLVAVLVLVGWLR